MFDLLALLHRTAAAAASRNKPTFLTARPVVKRFDVDLVQLTVEHLSDVHLLRVTFLRCAPPLRDDMTNDFPDRQPRQRHRL